MHEIPSFTSRTVQSSQLDVPIPKLGNLDALTTRDQVTLDRFLEASQALVEPTIDNTVGPLSLSLNLGLGASRSPLKSPNLAILATLLADRIRVVTGRQFAFIHFTKSHSTASHISVGLANPIKEKCTSGELTLITRQSYARPVFSEEITQATSNESEITSGPVALTLSFATGFPRTWSNLWQPTIRGLEPILGTIDRRGTRRIDEDRIVELKINHVSVGEILRHNIQITVAAQSTTLR